MKIDKLDSKQVPQVIALGVLSVGVVGYAIYGIAFGGPKRTAPTNDAASASSPAAATNSAVATVDGVAVPGTEVQVAKSTVPEITLPSSFNPDPFKTSGKAVGTLKPPVGVVTKPVEKARAVGLNAPVMPDASRPGGQIEPPKVKVETPPPPKPEKPEVHVTGTSVVDGMNLAILEVGQDHRVVQVGDLVAKGYRVKKIQLEGVLFSNKKESFFRLVGMKEDPKKDEDKEGVRPEL